MNLTLIIITTICILSAIICIVMFILCLSLAKFLNNVLDDTKEILEALDERVSGIDLVAKFDSKLSKFFGREN